MRWAQAVTAAEDRIPTLMLPAVLVGATELVRFFGSPEQAVVVKQRLAVMFESAGDDNQLAATLTDLSEVHKRLGDLEGARSAARRAVDLRREIGQPRGIAHALLGQADVELAAGDAAGAMALYSEGLPLAHGAFVPFLAWGCATCARRLGDRETAARHVVLALDAMPSLGYRQFYPDVLQEAAALAASEPASVRLLAASERLREETGRDHADRPDFERLLADARPTAGERFDALWAEGYALSDDEALSLARSVVE